MSFNKFTISKETYDDHHKDILFILEKRHLISISNHFSIGAFVLALFLYLISNITAYIFLVPFLTVLLSLQLTLSCRLRAARLPEKLRNIGPDDAMVVENTMTFIIRDPNPVNPASGIP